MAARLITPVTHITVARATTMAVLPTRSMAITRAGRIRIGVTERPRDIIRTRMGAVILPPTTTTTTRTIRQLTATAHHWLQPRNAALANSDITMA
jgi:hypothetical protein